MGWLLTFIGVLEKLSSVIWHRTGSNLRKIARPHQVGSILFLFPHFGTRFAMVRLAMRRHLDIPLGNTGVRHFYPHRKPKNKTAIILVNCQKHIFDITQQIACDQMSAGNYFPVSCKDVEILLLAMPSYSPTAHNTAAVSSLHFAFWKTQQLVCNRIFGKHDRAYFYPF